jgi:endonuclease/exonuclease/phosphatase family metal-dependent hydrolase
VNRDLLPEFADVIATAAWDVALLQECPPRWTSRLADRCDADAHRALTSRNSLAPLRSLAARLNPDLIASNEGGSNLTLVRRRAGAIVERRELTVSANAPERRVLAFTRIHPHAEGRPVCVANLHASAGRTRLQLAEAEISLAAERAISWAGSDPLLFGGDLNVRPRDSEIFAELERRHGLRGLTAADSLDHLLARGLEPAGHARIWSSVEREVRERGLAIRLSDHAPVEAAFRLPLTGPARGGAE